MARTRLIITWEKADPNTLAQLRDLVEARFPGDRIGYLLRRGGVEITDPDDARLEGVVRPEAHPI